MEATFVQEMKSVVVSLTGLTKDALHIYVGLAAFLLTAILLRQPLRSVVPWLVACALAVLGELVDMRDDYVVQGFWYWQGSLHDLFNTLFWPTMFLVCARAGILPGTIGAESPRRGAK